MAPTYSFLPCSSTSTCPKLRRPSFRARLSVAAPVNAMKRRVDETAAERAYEWTRQVYTNAGAREQFRILAAEHPLDASAYFALL